MALPRELLPNYTVRDYERWEGDWELIEGVPFALASPSVSHQRVLAYLLHQLISQLEECKNCEALPDTDYVVDEYTVLRTDIAVVCNNEGEKIVITPKVVFEIVSPSTAKNDEITKKRIYEREGVPYYVLVYPDLQKVKIFKNSSKGFKKVKDLSKEAFTFTFEGCKISLDFSKIWAKK